MKTKIFPCPICRGRGGSIEPVMDDGSGPYYSCGACDDSGFMEVGSEYHKRYFFNSVQWWDIILKFEPEGYCDEEWPRAGFDEAIADLEIAIRRVWELLSHPFVESQ